MDHASLPPLRRRLVLGGLAVFAGPVLPAPPTWPAGPVRLVCDEATAHPAAILASRLAAALRQTSSHPVEPVLRASSDGMAGAGEVARSGSSGGMLLVAPDAVITIRPHVLRKLPYDPSSLRPLAVLGASPLVLAMPPARAFAKLADLVGTARIRALSFGTEGIDSSGQMALAKLRRATGARLLHTPVPSARETVQAIARGDIDGGIVPLHEAIPAARAGEIKAVAVTGPHRSVLLPGVPTFAEEGLGQAMVETLIVVLAPAATPLALATAMQAALVEAAHLSPMRTLAAALGVEPEVLAGIDAVRRVATLRERYGEIAQAVGLRAS